MAAESARGIPGTGADLDCQPSAAASVGTSRPCMSALDAWRCMAAHVQMRLWRPRSIRALWCFGMGPSHRPAHCLHEHSFPDADDPTITPCPSHHVLGRHTRRLHAERMQGGPVRWRKAQQVADMVGKGTPLDGGVAPWVAAHKRAQQRAAHTACPGGGLLRRKGLKAANHRDPITTESNTGIQSALAWSSTVSQCILARGPREGTHVPGCPQPQTSEGGALVRGTGALPRAGKQSCSHPASRAPAAPDGATKWQVPHHDCVTISRQWHKGPGFQADAQASRKTP